MMLHSNLIYMVITRGKKIVVLIGAVKALAMAVKRTDSKQRVTTLRERLQVIRRFDNNYILFREPQGRC